MSTVQTQGIHHLGLTVPSIHESVEFFTTALGFSVVGEKPDYPATFVSDGHIMLTLWQAKTDTPVNFNRHENIGLHHFAIQVRDVEALQQAYESVKNYSGVEVEFSPEDLNGLPAKHMMCLIPGGIRMEIIAGA